MTLQFGYGVKLAFEKTISLDFSRQQTATPDLSRVWVQKKIAELDTRYEDHRIEIEQLGRRFGIVTRNTSLVVLESVNDYITYRIEPPADLRAEYDRILKQIGDNEGQTRRLVAGNAETYFNELLNWWQSDYTSHRVPDHPSHPVPDHPSHPVPDHPTPPAPDHTSRPGPHPVDRSLPNSASDTVFTAPLEGQVAGVSVQRSTNSKARGSASRQLDDVVVIGYGTARRKSVTGSVTTVDNEVPGLPGHGTTSNPATGNPATGNPATGNGSFTAALADLKTDYLVRLRATPAAARYAVYLQLRTAHLHTPLFYFSTADFFFASGQKSTGLKILSNIAELETESYELEKMLGYKLKELTETEAACAVFRKIMEWRPFEPQSYRDYGLALEDAGHYQQALDTLCYALTKNYDESVEALYPGIEETLLPEINSLVAKEKDKLDISRVPQNLLTNMPVDIRVVLNWNRSNTDIDLWVTDPDQEKCYYSHRTTEMGGRISHDFTRGLGPEQFLLKKATKGVYKVEVNYFGDTQVQLAGETTIMVEIYTNYGGPLQHRQMITLQMQRGAQGAVYVGQFDFK